MTQTKTPMDVLKDTRVLFAEDSPQTLDVFKQVVHKLDWKGIYASNAVEMMDVVNKTLAQGQTLDGVVADINFLTGPQVTGITAVREIRKVMPDVPVIFISSYVTSIIREEVRRVQAEIIEKPFDIDSLFRRLSQLIYWNKMITLDDYTGDDKRKRSLNRTDYHRRATDYILSTPERIAKTLEEEGTDK